MRSTTLYISALCWNLCWTCVCMLYIFYVWTCKCFVDNILWNFINLLSLCSDSEPEFCYTFLKCVLYLKLYFSVASSSAADECGKDGVGCYSRWAKWISVSSIVLGVITIIAVVVVLVVGKKHCDDVMSKFDTGDFKTQWNLTGEGC